MTPVALVRVTFILTSAAVLPAETAAAIWHVDPAATAGDGSAWTRPLRSVGAAVGRARAGDEIWLRAGVHPVAEPLRLPRGVALVGGFAGHERQADERRGINFARETTLRLTRPGASVLLLAGVRDVRLDGLTLTGASQAPAVTVAGCGPEVRFTHVRITGNSSAVAGAAIRITDGSEPVFFNCQFADNTSTAPEGGGGIFVDASSGGSWDLCIVNGNVAAHGSGGGAQIHGGSTRAVRFARTDFYFNTAAHTGSALSTAGPLELRDCVVASNLCHPAGPGHALAAPGAAARIILSGQSYVVSNVAGRDRPVLVRGIDGEERATLRDGALIAPGDTGPADPALHTSRNDVHVTLHDVFMPPLTTGAPAPGRWVRQTLPEYAGTAAYHCVYLPADWQPGRRFPVLAGFPGNGPYRNRYGDRSGGLPEDNPMGVGVSGGRGFIVLGLGYLDTRQNLQPTGNWWGDVPATLAYTQAAVRFVCGTYGGGPAGDRALRVLALGHRRQLSRAARRHDRAALARVSLLRRLGVASGHGAGLVPPRPELLWLRPRRLRRHRRGAAVRAARRPAALHPRRPRRGRGPERAAPFPRPAAGETAPQPPHLLGAARHPGKGRDPRLARPRSRPPRQPLTPGGRHH